MGSCWTRLFSTIKSVPGERVRREERDVTHIGLDESEPHIETINKISRLVAILRMRQIHILGIIEEQKEKYPHTQSNAHESLKDIKLDSLLTKIRTRRQETEKIERIILNLEQLKLKIESAINNNTIIQVFKESENTLSLINNVDTIEIEELLEKLSQHGEDVETVSALLTSSPSNDLDDEVDIDEELNSLIPLSPPLTVPGGVSTTPHHNTVESSSHREAILV